MNNIFLITIDAVRRDHLSCYGYQRKTTPNLDKFAKENIKVDWCFTPASYTAASVPSILSSKYPTHTKTRFGINLPYASSFTDLSPITQLRKAGYKTAAFTANPVTSKSINRSIGLFFDYFKDDYNKTKQKTPYKTSEEIISEVISYLKNNSENNFIWIHLMDAHGPYVPYAQSKFINDKVWKSQAGLPKITRMITDTFDGETLDSVLDQPGTQYYQLRDIKTDETGKIIDFEKDPRHNIAQYDMGIYLQDQSIGELFTFLKKNKLWRDSVIAVHSDHGETMGENGMWFNHAYLTTPELSLSPLIMKLKEHNSVKSGICSALDILPTILQSLKVPLPRGLDGKSLLTGKSNKRIYTIGVKDLSVVDTVKREIVVFHQGDLDYKAHIQPKYQLLPVDEHGSLNQFHFEQLFCKKYRIDTNAIKFVSDSFSENDIATLEKDRKAIIKEKTNNIILNPDVLETGELIQTLANEDSKYATEARDSLAEYEKWVKILQAENEVLKTDISQSIRLPKWLLQLRSNKI